MFVSWPYGDLLVKRKVAEWPPWANKLRAGQWDVGPPGSDVIRRNPKKPRPHSASIDGAIGALSIVMIGAMQRVNRGERLLMEFIIDVENVAILRFLAEGPLIFSAMARNEKKKQTNKTTRRLIDRKANPQSRRHGFHYRYRAGR